MIQSYDIQLNADTHSKQKTFAFGIKNIEEMMQDFYGDIEIVNGVLTGHVEATSGTKNVTMQDAASALTAFIEATDWSRAFSPF